LLLVVVVGAILWRLLQKKLRRHDGFEGLIVERREQPVRRKLSMEEEIERMESILNRK